MCSFLNSSLLSMMSLMWICLPACACFWVTESSKKVHSMIRTSASVNQRLEITLSMTVSPVKEITGTSTTSSTSMCFCFFSSASSFPVRLWNSGFLFFRLAKRQYPKEGTVWWVERALTVSPPLFNSYSVPTDASTIAKLPSWTSSTVSFPLSKAKHAE